MKLLVINTAGLAIGGITTNMYNYLSRIKDKSTKIDLVVTVLQDEVSVKRFQNIGCSLYYLPHRTKKPFLYMYKLYLLCKKNKYDIVHIHGNSHTVVIDLLPVWMAGCVVRMVHAHNTTCSHVVVHKLLSIPFNLLYTHALACGQAAGRMMFGNKHVTIVNNGVDTDLYKFNSETRDFIRSKHKWDNCRVLGHVGIFLEIKNQTFIVDVFKELYQKDNSYRLVLIGEGPMQNCIRDKVERLGLKDMVTFTGNINNVHEYLNAIDLILMPSLFEGLPLTLIEQQANGLQCVCSDTITKEADKSGNLHFISLNKSAKEWAEEVNTFIKTDEREQRSHNAIINIIKTGYSIKEEAKKLSAFYKNSIKTK